MKKMKLRRAIIFTVFLLFPIIQFYFSPFLSIASAFFGVINISILVFFTLFVLGIFIGRAPCGWFMPCGGMQEACFYFQDKKIYAGKKDRIKYIIFIPWFLTLLVAIFLNFRIIRIEPFFNMNSFVSVSEPWMYIIYYGVLFLLFALVLILGRRGLCHYVCWMAPFMIWGKKLGSALKLPGLRLTAEYQKCISCRKCSKTCPMGIDVHELVQNKSMHHDECILCGECVQTCPPQLLHIKFCRYKNR